MGYEPIGVFIGPLRPLYGTPWWPLGEPHDVIGCGLIEDVLAGDGPYVWQADRYLEAPT